MSNTMARYVLVVSDLQAMADASNDRSDSWSSTKLVKLRTACDHCHAGKVSRIMFPYQDQFVDGPHCRYDAVAKRTDADDA